MTSEHENHASTTPDDAATLSDDLIAASRSDFKVALTLLLFAIVLLIHTLGFPMSGSYGGVESQWYISPALFPLIVCSLLILCSGLLLAKTVKHQGYNQLFAIKGWVGDWQFAPIRDRWFVIWTLLVYVFALIPSTDFYIASVIFLVSLTSHFYYATANSAIFITLLQLFLAITLISIKLSVNAYEDTTWLTVNQDEQVILYSDLSSTIALFILLAANWIKPAQRCNKTAFKQSLIVLLVPLVLVIIFTFLLYVPTPVEYGTVSNFLSYIVYEVLAIS